MKLHLEQQGPHEAALRKHFQRFQFQGELAPITDPVCIMLFTNRSGSTLVSEYLRATGQFVAMGEHLNQQRARERSTRFDISTFPEYIAHHYQTWRQPGKCYGMKASYDQAIMLVRAGIIPSLLAQVSWVLIQRRDILAQAISFTIAEQTRQWHSFDSVEAAEPRYDFERILHRIQALSQANASLQNFCALLDIKPYRLEYEEFAANPVAGTRGLARFLGQPDASVNPDKLKMHRQRGETNRLFRQRFLEDYRRRLGASVPDTPGQAFPPPGDSD